LTQDVVGPGREEHVGGTHPGFFKIFLL